MKNLTENKCFAALTGVQEEGSKTNQLPDIVFIRDYAVKVEEVYSKNPSVELKTKKQTTNRSPSKVSVYQEVILLVYKKAAAFRSREYTNLCSQDVPVSRSVRPSRRRSTHFTEDNSRGKCQFRIPGQ